MPALEYIPPWTIDYNYSVTPNVLRSPDLGGFRSQAKITGRRVVVVSAQRILKGSELMYFEWFIRGVCNDGSIKFEDYYSDHNGTTVGTVRIVGGAYEVTTDKRKHTVTCDLEIFR
jgi:hypothetical protein